MGGQAGPRPGEPTPGAPHASCPRAERPGSQLRGRSGRCCLSRSLWARWKSNSAGGLAPCALISPAPGGRERLFAAGLPTRRTGLSPFQAGTVAEGTPVTTGPASRRLSAPHRAPKGKGEGTRRPPRAAAGPGLPGLGVLGGLSLWTSQAPFSGSWVGLANGVLLADGEGWGFVSGPPRGSQPQAVPLWKAGVPDGSALCPGRWARRPSACPSRSPHSGTPGGPSEARLPVAPRSSVLLENSFCLSQILVEPLPCVGQCSGAGDRATGRAGAPGARRASANASCCRHPGRPGAPRC